MGTAVGLCDEHSLVHPDLSLQPGAGILGVHLSEEASHFSAHRCVFCQVLAVSHLVFEVDVRPHLGADSASTERAASAERGGAANAYRSPSVPSPEK